MSDTPRQLDLVSELLHRWKLIVLAGIVGLGAGIAYAMLAPSWYSARLAVVPAQRNQTSPALSLMAKLPGGLDSVSTDVQRIQAVLTSTSVADEVIEKFKLDERYGTAHREHTRAQLWKHCVTNVDRKSGIVELTCEDQEPAQAKAMAEYFGEVGNRVFGRVSASSAREERRFLETQVQSARRDVDDASQKLRVFQERHRVVDLPEQSKAVISAMAAIKGDLISKQMELSYLSSFSARTEPRVVQLQQQISIMEAKLSQLESSRLESLGKAPSSAGSAAGSAASVGTFFPGAMTVPELRFELEQLLRDQKIKETVFALMTERFEMAKVDEARDTSTFQILDHPTLPTYRSRPRRLRVVATGATAAVLLASAAIVAAAWVRSRRRQ